jgi:hypothetical protein
MTLSRISAFWLLFVTQPGCEGAARIGAKDIAVRRVKRMIAIDAYTPETFYITGKIDMNLAFVHCARGPRWSVLNHW